MILGLYILSSKSWLFSENFCISDILGVLCGGGEEKIRENEVVLWDRGHGLEEGDKFL